MKKKMLNINGVVRTVIAAQDDKLAEVIREQLLLTGAKIGCGQGQCGACNVILNGKLVRSCVTKMSKVPNDSIITTVEGLGTPDNLHAIQYAWMVHGAAQCGFCSPGFIVSAKALLDENQSPTREDVRAWFQKYRNACRCTGYKPIVDAVMDAARVMRGEMSMDDLAFKMPEDSRIWGSKYPRPTALAKVTGTCDYGADLGLKLPKNTLQLALVQAKVSHADIKGIDTSEAEKMEGVYKVVTHKDVKGKNRITGLITFPTNKGDGWDRPILCDEKVFQFGDAIAIVCADTQKNAKAAAEKVKVELEQLPEYMSAPAAMAEDAMEIHPGTPNIYFTQKIAKGEETGPIFDKADVVVEDDFYVGRQPHMPIEPDVGFAYYDDEGRLVIQSKSIGIHLHHAMIAPGLGIEPEKLVIVQNPAGGTFGYKFSPTMEALVGTACMATGRPVFLNYDWFQQQTYTGKRSPFFVNMRFAADKEGKLLGMETDWSVDHGPYSEFGDLLTLRGAQFMGAGYDIPNIRGEGRTVCTNHSWGSAFRAYGSPQSEFSSEVLMDELAEKLGMDPLEIRYKNVYRNGCTNPSGQEPEAYSFPEMLDMLRPKYQAAKERARKESTEDRKCGVGISLGVYGCGLDGPDSAEAWVALNPDNTITVATSWEDHGQGADMGTMGTAHEALRPLNIGPEKIKLLMNDTSVTPNSGPAGGSRCQVLVGQAIRVACETLIGATEQAGLFTGGSAPEKAGFSPVTMAAQGRWAATSMDRYLQNVSMSAGREKEGSYDTRLFTSLEGVESQPAVDPADPKKGYTGEEAVQEAGRCLQCECLECVKICPYLAHYRGYPRKYAREIYNNASIVMGERKANTMINTCSLCRLCETVCPEDFSMAGLCHEARTDMIQKDRMPPSAHEFALQDMDFSNSDKFALARHQPGFDTSTHLFYPGCHLSGTAPEHVFNAYSHLSDQLSGGVGIMLGCCGAPAWWSGRKARFQEILDVFKAQWTEMGKPRIIPACTSCHRMFSEGIPEAEVVSLWEVLEEVGLPENSRPKPPESPVAVIDPCTVRRKPEIRNSARHLLDSLNIEVDELKYSGELTECCGFGGLMANANPPVARKVLERRVRQSPRDYLAYCGMCRDRLAKAGKRTVHLLDFIWRPEMVTDPAEREDPGFSYRHENRARLKNRFLREVWKERTQEMEAYEKIALNIPEAVRERLESRRILTEDIQKVLHHVHEAKGPVFENSGTGRYLAYYRPLKVTFWVEYTPQKDGGFLIHNAYSHRMEIVEESSA